MDKLAVILLPIKVVLLIIKAITLIAKHLNKPKKLEKTDEPKIEKADVGSSAPESFEPISFKEIHHDIDATVVAAPPPNAPPIRDFDELRASMATELPHLTVSKAEFDEITNAFGYDAASTVGFAMRKLNNIQAFMEETQATVDIQQTSGLHHLTTVEDFISWRNGYWGEYYDK